RQGPRDGVLHVGPAWPIPDDVEHGARSLAELEVVPEDEAFDDALALRSEQEPDRIHGRIGGEAPGCGLEGQCAAWAESPESSTASAGLFGDRGAQAGEERGNVLV